MSRSAAAGVVPAGLCTLLYGSGAVAGPPLSIDDPGILAIGAAEFIVAATVEERSSGTAYYLPIIDISYGLAPNVQMSVTATRAVTEPTAAESKSDFGPAALGVKWRFLDRDGLQMAIAPFFETSLRDGAEDRGVIDDVNAWFIPVNLQYEWTAWRLNAEVAYAAAHGADDEWAYGIALTRPVAEGLELMGELHGGAQRDFGDHGIQYRVGLDWGIRPALHLLMSVGSSIHESGPDDVDLQGFLGLQWFH